MAKQILGDYDLPEEGDIIDQVANQQERLSNNKERVKQLKEKTNFLTLLTSFGIEVKKNGNGHMAKCPFHADKTPSLSVEPEKQLFHCFGCGVKGDLIEFVKLYKHTDFKGALEVLKKYHGLMHKPIEPVEKKKTPEVLFTEETELEKKNLVKKVIEDYHAQLVKNEKALTFLETRGLKDFELMKQFTIGFSDGSTLIPKLSVKQNELLKQAGIINTKDKEHFAGCIVFPVILEHGSVGEIYARSITGQKPPHRYLKGKHEGIFNRKASKVYDEIILTESIIDALSLIRLGIVNVQAIYGTKGFTEEHLQTLKADRVKTIVLALDNDDSGKAASGELKEKLLREDFGVKIIVPPEVKDWNDCLLAGMSKEDVVKLIEEAETVKPDTEGPDLKVEKKGLGYVFKIKEMKYTLYGVNELFIQHLKVNIKAEYCPHNEDKGKSWTDNADLCSAKSRCGFAVNLAARFGLEDVVIENDLNNILGFFEKKRDLRFEATGEKKKVELSEAEKKLGMDLLCNENVFDTILSHAGKLGYAGQEENVLIMFIVGISRFQKEPLSIYLTGESSSGKTAIVRLLEKMTLKEDIWKANSISPEVLYYVEENKYKGKIFIMGEATHDEKVEGIVRQMQSDGEIAKLVTRKNEQSGAMDAEYIQKKVQMSFIITTTKVGINPENLSRCLVLTLDEDKQQISEAQGMIGLKHSFEKERANMEAELIIKQHYAAQYLLEPVKVFNIFGKLTRFPSSRPTMKRAFDHFLYFIDSVCYFRQKQKPWVIRKIGNPDKKVRGKKCDLYDYEIAYRLYVQRVLKNTGLTDIAMSTRNIYEKIRQMVRKKVEKKGLTPGEISFMQRDLREFTGLRHEFVKKHLRLLLNYEYITAVSGRSRGTRNVYRLRDDMDMIELDISMITTPRQMKEIYEEADKQEKEMFQEEEEWD